MVEVKLKGPVTFERSYHFYLLPTPLIPKERIFYELVFRHLYAY
jgi:hypothetical protein